ncbi:MAG TPA: amidase domain-containing protein [Oscillospiraceae bacterium]|nr:amidase domain-containing protein [Oscillospiraceae bacterium]HPK35506.1 amidase domain-containing protein [Oscillospiraceae bacterium]HPR76044.1 amidase domain-containing protein [Oscillospiraceae bacterium]
MLKTITYNRAAVVRYAEKWAFGRNPRFPNFDGMGGDCTNFASQCMYAGCGVMNYKPVFGWYCNSLNDRTPSWSGVEFLYNFLVNNDSVGPYAQEVPTELLLPGDLIQLCDSSGHFYHTPVVVARDQNEIYVAAHTFNAWHRPLSSYIYAGLRGLHIEGARKLG